MPAAVNTYRYFGLGLNLGTTRPIEFVRCYATRPQVHVLMLFFCLSQNMSTQRGGKQTEHPNGLWHPAVVTTPLRTTCDAPSCGRFMKACKQHLPHIFVCLYSISKFARQLWVDHPVASSLSAPAIFPRAYVNILFSCGAWIIGRKKEASGRENRLMIKVRKLEEGVFRCICSLAKAIPCCSLLVS